MATAQMFNPLAMAEGNLKVIRECMDKGEIVLFVIISSILLKTVLWFSAAGITDFCASAFVIFQCIFEKNSAAFGRK